MNTLIGSGVVFCVLAIVGLFVIFFILSFFLPIFGRGGTSNSVLRRGGFIHRPPGSGSSSTGGHVGTHSTGSGGRVGGHSTGGRGGGSKGGGSRGGKR